MMNIQEITAPICPIRCQGFFVLKKVNFQIRNSRPRKALSTYFANMKSLHLKSSRHFGTTILFLNI